MELTERAKELLTEQFRELIRTQNHKGKPYLVYIDAEFQTYRVPEDADMLKARGFVNTPYHHGMNRGNFKHNKYHFLLNFGYIVVGPDSSRHEFAAFRSSFKSDAGFENPQILEPGYATCPPYTDNLITELRKIIGGEGGSFPYYADFSTDEEKKKAFEEINSTYNSSIDEVESMTSYATFSHFLTDIAPHAMIVHKGRNDLYALWNTARLLGLTMPNILARDLDAVRLNLPGLKTTKLLLMIEYFTKPPPLPINIGTADPVHVSLHRNKDCLILFRKILLESISAFFIIKWGALAGEIAAHNPLVDCAHAAIIDLGLGSAGDGAIFLFGTDSNGGVSFVFA